MEKIMVILHKEWLEITQQRGLVLGILLMPLFFTLLPIGVVYLVGHIPSSSSLNVGTIPLNPAFKGLTKEESIQALLGAQFSIFYLLLPTLMTSIIASYSIVGEKTSRTLEPLLATPVRTWELLTAKCLASLIPAVVATWLSGALFIAAMAVFATSGRVFTAIVGPGWLVIFLLWTPLLGVISVAAMVAISSRVNDPRTAQQLSAWAVVPFMGMFFSQLGGLQVLGPIFTLSVAVVLVPLAILSVWGASRIFQREVILTRWK